MKRLGVFQMSDPDGIVDDYILYLLKDLTENLDELIITVNGELCAGEEKKLEKFTSKIFFRSNSGYDAIAYRDTILDYAGIDYVRGFEELVLCNDTFFGPFYPFKDIFMQMDAVKADFWGLTRHAEYRRLAIYMPEHLQSFFLVIRTDMLRSGPFEEFWNLMHDIRAFQQLVYDFEIRFTTYFCQHGFCYEAFVRDEELNRQPDFNYNHYAYIPYILLARYGMPVLKRKDFIDSKNISMSMGDELSLAMDWIKDNTSYDIDLILKNIIRRYTPVDLKKNLNLTYVLSEVEGGLDYTDQAAVIVYLTNEQELAENLAYLYKIQGKLFLRILTDKKIIADKLAAYFDSQNISVIADRGKEYAFITGCKDIIHNFKYICFAHDEYTDVPEDYDISGISVNRMIWENTLHSINYINTVLATLENDSYLGVLSVPEPMHSDYVKKRADEWKMTYSELLALSKRVGLHCVMESEKRAFTFSYAGWFRSDAIRKLVEFPFADMEYEKEIFRNSLKYSLIYAAQDTGRYSGIAETISYAKMELENQNVFIESYEKFMRKKSDLVKFARKHKKLFVYGAGYEGKKVRRVLREFDCPIESFVVSDSHCEDTFQVEEKVIPVSKVPSDPDVGIILAMNSKNMYEVQQVLHNKNFSNIFYVN